MTLAQRLSYLFAEHGVELTPIEAQQSLDLARKVIMACGFEFNEELFLAKIRLGLGPNPAKPLWPKGKGDG